MKCDWCGNEGVPCDKNGKCEPLTQVPHYFEKGKIARVKIEPAKGQKLCWACRYFLIREAERAIRIRAEKESK